MSDSNQPPAAVNPTQPAAFNFGQPAAANFGQPAAFNFGQPAAFNFGQAPAFNPAQPPAAFNFGQPAAFNPAQLPVFIPGHHDVIVANHIEKEKDILINDHYNQITKNNQQENKINIKVTHQGKIVIIPLYILEKYPESPIYNYWKEYELITLNFEDICQNINYELDFNTFVIICDILCGKKNITEQSFDIKKIMDKLGLISPLKMELYQAINDKTNEKINKLDNFLNNCWQILEIKNEAKFNFYKLKFSKNKNFIPFKFNNSSGLVIYTPTDLYYMLTLKSKPLRYNNLKIVDRDGIVSSELYFSENTFNKILYTLSLVADKVWYGFLHIEMN